MRNFLNIIIIGENENEISKTLDSVKFFLNNKRIKIIIIFPKSRSFKLNLKNYQNIILDSDEGKGIYSAMNKGLEFVERRFSLIWFLNAGDYAISEGICSQKFEKLNKEDIVFFISNKNLNLNKYVYKILKYFKKSDGFIIKFLIICLIFPSSHQNIFINSNKHINFSESYKYSSDFYLVAKLIFLNNSKVIIKIGSIAETSYGGVTDMNRYKTLHERYISLKSLFQKSNKKIFLTIINLSFIVRKIFLIPGQVKLYFLNFLNN